MKIHKTLFLGLLASSVAATTAHSQGLLGKEYSEFSGGYVRISGPGETLDGFGASAAVNAPMVTDRLFGMDFRGDIGYGRATDGNITRSSYGGQGLFRGYAPVTDFFAPFVETGLSWARAKTSVPGQRARASGFSLPLGIGAEFSVDAFSVTPFFRYDVGLDFDQDVWLAGAKGAFWITPEWGMTLTVAHVDHGADFDGIQATLGFLYVF